MQELPANYRYLTRWGSTGLSTRLQVPELLLASPNPSSLAIYTSSNARDTPWCSTRVTF